MGLFVNPRSFQNDKDGRASPFATYDFYETNSTVRKEVYEDSALSVPLSNPVVADAAGRFPLMYLADDTPYRVVYSERQFKSSVAPLDIVWDESDVLGSIDRSTLGTSALLDVTTSDTDITTDRVSRTNNAWYTAQAGDFLDYGGTPDAIELTSINTTPITSLVDGMQVRCLPTARNTGPATLNVDGLGAKPIVTVTLFATPADYIYEAETVLRWDETGDQWVASRKVESGSNTNGEFTRWENGRMDCFVSKDSSTDWTYPIPFISPPTVVPSGAFNIGSPRIVGLAGLNSTSVTITRQTTSGVASNGPVYAVAKGNWY